MSEHWIKANEYDRLDPSSVQFNDVETQSVHYVKTWLHAQNRKYITYCTVALQYWPCPRQSSAWEWSGTRRGVCASRRCPCSRSCTSCTCECPRCCAVAWQDLCPEDSCAVSTQTPAVSDVYSYQCQHSISSSLSSSSSLVAYPARAVASLQGWPQQILALLHRSSSVL